MQNKENFSQSCLSQDDNCELSGSGSEDKMIEKKKRVTLQRACLEKSEGGKAGGEL